MENLLSFTSILVDGLNPTDAVAFTFWTGYAAMASALH